MFLLPLLKQIGCQRYKKTPNRRPNSLCIMRKKRKKKRVSSF